MSYVALITGASSGIGAATARLLAQDPSVRLVLVARREERLRALAQEIGSGTMYIAADLTHPTAATRIADAIARHHGQLNLLVNNAGARWSAEFADGGWANVEQHLRINFEAPVRLVEALLPLMRRTAESARAGTGGAAAAPGSSGAGGQRATSDRLAGQALKAPVAVVNVSSTSGRIGRYGAGAYAASKFALGGWSDSLYLEEREHGVHVGLVLPGFISTEGFPAAELRANWRTRWLVDRPEHVARAILDAGPGGEPERHVPRGYWLVSALRILAPGAIRRLVSTSAFTTRAEPRSG